MLSRHLPCAATALSLAMGLALPLAAHGAEALRLIRDPQTGELRGPTAAEAAAYAKAQAQLRTAAGKNQAAPTEITHPDGAVELKLGEDSMLSSVATLDADGNLSYACLPAKEAQKLVKSGLKPSAPKTAATTAIKKAGHQHE